MIYYILDTDAGGHRVVGLVIELCKQFFDEQVVRDGLLLVVLAEEPSLTYELINHRLSRISVSDVVLNHKELLVGFRVCSQKHGIINLSQS